MDQKVDNINLPKNVYCCPKCGILIELEQINCGIIRCMAIFRNSTYKQVNPHAKHSEILKLKEENKQDLIVGCGSALKLDLENNILKITSYDK